MRVSVLVPVYNKTQKQLSRCFDSILNQTCKDFELIITDDGSNPEVATFLDKYTEGHKSYCIGGVHCFHYQNGGVWIARNRGQEKASGDWIMHVNADDFIDPLTIHTALEAADTHKNVDMVYWGLWDVDWPPHLSYEGCGGDRFYSNLTTEKFHIREDLLCATPFCDVTCMVRRDKSQPFNSELTGAEFEHQVRMIAGCSAIYFVDRAFYYYVTSKNTISSCQADISWRINALKNFRDSLVAHGYSTVDEYLVVYAVSVIHIAAEHPSSVYKKIDNSVVSEILRSKSIKELSPMTRKMSIICTLFKARQFFLLGVLLKLARGLNKFRIYKWAKQRSIGVARKIKGAINH